MIHNYAITITPNEREAELRFKEILGKLEKELKLSFFTYLYSGYNLYSPTYIEE